MLEVRSREPIQMASPSRTNDRSNAAFNLQHRLRKMWFRDEWWLPAVTVGIMMIKVTCSFHTVTLFHSQKRPVMFPWHDLQCCEGIMQVLVINNCDSLIYWRNCLFISCMYSSRTSSPKVFDGVNNLLNLNQCKDNILNVLYQQGHWFCKHQPPTTR